MQKFYTLAKILKNGKQHKPPFSPMTHKEACTFKSKMMQPHKWILVEVKPTIAKITNNSGFITIVENIKKGYKRISEIIILKPMFQGNSEWFEFVPIDAKSTLKTYPIHVEDFTILTTNQE